MTHRLTTGAVRQIYDLHLKCGTLRDQSGLDAAVNAPFHTWEGVDLFPTLAGQAGKLLDGIQRAQAFTDGNKRLAWLSTTTFLAINGQGVSAAVSAVEVNTFVRELVGDPRAANTAALWLSTRMTGFV